MTDFLTERVEVLILARLSVAGNSPSSPKVGAALFAFVAAQLTHAEWRLRFATTIRSLREQGLIEREKLRLTATGWTRLQKWLGLNTRPVAKNWKAFTTKYLPQLVGPRTGRSPDADLALILLSERLRLPSDAAKTPARLVNAWLRQTYGIRSSQVTLAALRTALLARELGIPPKGDLERVVRVGAARLAGAPKGSQQELTRALTTRWLAGVPSTQNGGPDKGVQANAHAAGNQVLLDKVKAAAQRADVHHFGADKAFIGSVWNALRDDPEVASLGEGGFKRMLVDAHTAGALVLARADLVAAMNPADVAASETRHLNATYHFIQI